MGCRRKSGSLELGLGGQNPPMEIQQIVSAHVNCPYEKSRCQLETWIFNGQPSAGTVWPPVHFYRLNISPFVGDMSMGQNYPKNRSFTKSLMWAKQCHKPSPGHHQKCIGGMGTPFPVMGGSWHCFTHIISHCTGLYPHVCWLNHHVPIKLCPESVESNSCTDLPIPTQSRWHLCTPQSLYLGFRISWRPMEPMEMYIKI